MQDLSRITLSYRGQFWRQSTEQLRPLLALTGNEYIMTVMNG